MIQTGRLFLEDVLEDEDVPTTYIAKYKQFKSTRHSAETELDLFASFAEQVCRSRHARMSKITIIVFIDNAL